MAVKGILAARIRPVTIPPNSGFPEDSSKTDPTPAIAVIQHNNKHTPLLGVIEIIFIFL
jgi:hypothetical protein